MPPRKNSVDRLTEQDLTELAAAVAAGKRATVYLNDATPSLGLAEGCSARVLSIDGATVLIRPKGVNDELPFEADELRRTRLPAKTAARAAKAASAKPAVAKSPSAKPASGKPAAAKSAVAKPAVAAAPKSVPAKVVDTRVAPAAPPKPAPVAATVSVTPPKATVTAPKADPDTRASENTAPAPRRARRAKDPASVSVTLHAEAGNEWTVTVTHGERRPGKAAPVSADAVERAVRELGDPAAEQAVASVLSAAREAAARRVEELSRQLAEARDTLESLGAEGI
ncbi:translation initiation factor [Rhodococcus tukisamuensis]|uniref:Translation initiation factor n=1 Tax=Rhodococcus tukisamuensis TaxID=168276 RepID=A0A1G6SBZ7_9NOCA|nr:translation initiation factor [Rhodococcus tukisamuensis]SDD14184.1 hypothetical protein SAMN05444580_10380 [Rhodococcus tukisamuensis]